MWKQILLMDIYSHYRMIVRIQAVLYSHALETEFCRNNHESVNVQYMRLFLEWVFSTNEKVIR